MLDGRKYGSRNETGEDIASCELLVVPSKSSNKTDKVSKADKVRPHES